MISGDTRLRVYNRCKYDIGVITSAGLPVNIAANTFRMFTANDVLFIETNCNSVGYFSSGMLVPTDVDGKEISISEFGLYTEDVKQIISDDEITSMLKQSTKKIEAWLKDITDETELHSIYMVAKDLDLPMSKVKILKAAMPNKDWLDER